MPEARRRTVTRRTLCREAKAVPTGLKMSGLRFLIRDET